MTRARQTGMPRARHLQIPLAVAATLLALTLTACAGPVGSTGTGSSTGPIETPSVSAPVTKAGPKVTLTGTLSEGVEAGCTLLRAEDGKEYLLVGAAVREAAKKGGALTVTGQVQEGLVTTCMQGIPFLVDRVETP